MDIALGGIENDFALGFIVGLNEKFEKQKQENKEWGWC